MKVFRNLMGDEATWYTEEEYDELKKEIEELKKENYQLKELLEANKTLLEFPADVVGIRWEESDEM